MTDEQYAEIRALRERLAQMERMAQAADEGRPMYEQKRERREAAAAERWREDPAMERLAKWRDAGDPRYDRTPVGQKGALGYYLNDKRIAKERAK